MWRVTKTFSFKGMRGLSNRTMLKAVGIEMAVRVQNRTMSGKDESNRKFVPYNPAYAKRKNVPRSPVTLFRSGRMLNELNVTDLTDNSVKVGWRDPQLEELARYHDRGKGHNPKRPFLGVPDSWVRLVVKYVKDHLKMP